MELNREHLLFQSSSNMCLLPLRSRQLTAWIAPIYPCVVAASSVHWGLRSRVHVYVGRAQRFVFGADCACHLCNRQESIRRDRRSNCWLALAFCLPDAVMPLLIWDTAFGVPVGDRISSVTAVGELRELPTMGRGRPILGRCLPGKPRADFSSSFLVALSWFWEWKGSGICGGRRLYPPYSC